jgi:AmmeMemoRadiSam system protein A
MQFTPAQQQVLLDAARAGILDGLRGTTHYSIGPDIDPALRAAAGCFVSLHDRATHRLRGCVGRLQSPDPLIQGVYETARSVLVDPRFRNNPVTLGELPALELEVSVLTPLVPAKDPLDFEPLEDGIYLMCEGRAGTFLPQVARETGWSREQLLSRLCTEKMGLSPDAWRGPGARLLKYRAVVIGPAPVVEEPPRTGGNAAPPPPGGLGFGGSVFGGSVFGV